MRQAIADHAGRLFARRRNQFAALATAAIVATLCVDLGSAQAQPYSQRRQQRGPDVVRIVTVEYKGDRGEVIVTDSKQNQKELLRQVMRNGDTAKVRALATITRETQKFPEIQLRWKVSGPVDEKGALPAPDKRMTWCGFVDESERRTTFDVGLQTSGVRGRGC